MSNNMQVALEKIGEYQSSLYETKWCNINNYRWHQELTLSKDKEVAEKLPKLIMCTGDFFGQNSLMFGKLCGCCATEEPFVEPRKLPDNASEATKEEYKSWDYIKETTWYNLKELMDFVSEYHKNHDKYSDWDKEIDTCLQEFINNLVSHIYCYGYEYNFDEAVDDKEAFYKNHAEKYRVILWFT